MDSVEINQAEKKLEEAIDEELLLLSDPNGFFDIPMVDPRVGDEYQAEIPPMLTLSQLLELSTNPIESESTTENVSCSFLLGLPMPITWICNDQPNTCKVDRAGFFPVPGLSPESWTDFEVESFVLGLYVFGKNLLQVQRFMETKDVGQIQRYYYATFYKSQRYCKWVDCRKMRNKKCVMGSKIFTGFRQHELLSRLLPYLSEEEAKNTFQEISNALVEERTSLEEYVSSLKRMVGVRALVEAMRIGKGKEDLTAVITDNSKSGQRQRVRGPELPSGKACSSLASADIIRLLTSDIRLSKARSNDLFWEAVWPRLLARGWHSEQPNDICTAPKNNLVFLMPGVGKFSRRKLVNGTHYFDSVSDVLRKVASEPRLLDLEGEDGDVHREKDRPFYLKPNVMKFTVIDTSLPANKVRELRSLPAGDSGIKRQKPSFVLSLPASTDEGSFGFRECCSKGKKSPSPSKPHLLLIDLNLPHVPSMEEEHELKNGDVDVSSRRRHSTRTRPLTTKALEALEIGFLSLRQSRKRKKARSDEVSYGEPGSSDSPLVQNNETTAWSVETTS